MLDADLMRFPSFRKFFRSIRAFQERPEVVPHDVESQRENVCDGCEFSNGFQCQKCTCYIPLKVKLATESCPIGSWGEYFNQNHNGLVPTPKPDRN